MERGDSDDMCPLSESELEIYERRDFGRHELYDELHHYKECQQPDYPWRPYEYQLGFVGISLGDEMHHDQSRHHDAPHHARLEELMNLIPSEVDEDVPDDKEGLTEIGRPEEYPQQRHIYERQRP